MNQRKINRIIAREERRRARIRNKIATRIVAGVCVILFIVGMLAACENNKQSVKDYNNGSCPNCGHDYESYERFESSDGNTLIVYECPRCHKRGNINTNLLK